MTAKTMNPGTGHFLKSEANGSLSREAIVIASGVGVLLAGTVLGKVTATGKYKAYDNDASDGTEVFWGGRRHRQMGDDVQCFCFTHLLTKPRPSFSTCSQHLGVRYGLPLSNISNSPGRNSVHPFSSVNGFVVMTATRSVNVVTVEKSML